MAQETSHVSANFIYLSHPVTLKIRSRSTNLISSYVLSQSYIYAVLTGIYELVHKIFYLQCYLRENEVKVTIS